MSDLVLYFGENFMKLHKNNEVTADYIQVCGRVLRNKIQIIFNCSKVLFSMLLNDFKVKYDFLVSPAQFAQF